MDKIYIAPEDLDYWLSNPYNKDIPYTTNPAEVKPFLNEPEDNIYPPSQAKGPYKGLLLEMGIISAIISEPFLKQLYAQPGVGYYDALGIISQEAVSFYKKHEREIEDGWRSKKRLDRKEEYDDVILAHTINFVKEKFDINLKLF